MEIFHNLLIGFQVAVHPINVMYCFIGVILGTLIGVLPGIGPVATMSLLLPITFSMSPTASIIMMAGIYYGAMYGGSTTSILVNIPGEAASVVTCIDGYQMARQGRAGPALGISAFGSFIAGTFSVMCIMLLAPPLTSNPTAGPVSTPSGPTVLRSFLLCGSSGPSRKASTSRFESITNRFSPCSPAATTFGSAAWFGSPVA